MFRRNFVCIFSLVRLERGRNVFLRENRFRLFVEKFLAEIGVVVMVVRLVSVFFLFCLLN